ncbi:MAG: tRNA (adenine-N1)-methyltransferase [Candidatus Aenigmatarchaeota archaeon]
MMLKSNKKIEKIKDNDLILLLSKEKNFLVSKSLKVFQSQYGFVNLENITHYGQKIETSDGHKFTIVKPSVIDKLKKCKRMPQIVMPKDAAQIVAVTGLSNGWKCLDAGSGSGFLAIFIGNIVKPDGHVYTYEKNRKFADNVRKNVKLCGLEKIVTIINNDVKNFKEKDLDLITIDMINAEKLIKKAYKNLKPGGWICIYSPHIEQQKNVVKEIEKLNFTQIQTIENIQRQWQVNSHDKGYTHPKPSGILHTGFMTFARKI